MSSLVVDASMALSWCFEDEHDELSDSVLQAVIADGGITPPLWTLEIVNAFLVAERRGRISRADTERFLALFDSLPLETSEFDPSADALVAAGREHHLSSYDASYLLAASQSGSRLATRDAALLRAASAVGVPVFTI